MKKLEDNNVILVDNSSTFPLNHDIQAKNHVKFNDEFNEPKIKAEFIEEIKNTEKQESILVKNLDDLFD